MAQLKSDGLFDLQVNGYGGIDFNDASLTAEKMDIALQAMLDDGVTGCLPTLITASKKDLLERIVSLDIAVRESRLGRVMVPGYHLEGPFLNSEDGYIGCHPKGGTCDPDAAFILSLEKDIKLPILLVTLAPELSGALETIKKLHHWGKVIAIGHSSAGHDDVRAAAEAGMTLSTHLGNGLPQQLPKFDNTLLAQLAQQRLTACFIADGHHIPKADLKAMLSIKGIDNSILVTDAVSPAACAPGLYKFARMNIEKSDQGKVTIAGDNMLAGSALCLNEAVRNVIEWKLVTTEQAFKMASKNPRAALSHALEYHNITLDPGNVIWDDNFDPQDVQYRNAEFPSIT
ncbi:MAG: N-acetylglucosamine-6-phosphate deacetylase [Kordiimonadaceae bacterium]|jgi:N-acetylglucosamine-6-phosphate deacetylase|nr:N-acetylglucosamine-6-phosphate deacetylase [Kordiimonadaceae bacterium]MBT6032560.1 N-acetylglucosamine-6-phosphate deacetylase [Kordiimonadaceae bacterium]